MKNKKVANKYLIYPAVIIAVSINFCIVLINIFSISILFEILTIDEFDGYALLGLFFSTILLFTTYLFTSISRDIIEYTRSFSSHKTTNKILYIAYFLTSLVIMVSVFSFMLSPKITSGSVNCTGKDIVTYSFLPPSKPKHEYKMKGYIDDMIIYLLGVFGSIVFVALSNIFNHFKPIRLINRILFLLLLFIYILIRLF